MPEPMWTPSLGELVASRPSVRFSHPERLASPGLASSTSSIASKCDRFGHRQADRGDRGHPLVSQRPARGASAGCSPNIASRLISEAVGTSMVGRAAV